MRRPWGINIIGPYNSHQRVTSLGICESPYLWTRVGALLFCTLKWRLVWCNPTFTCVINAMRRDLGKMRSKIGSIRNLSRNLALISRTRRSNDDLRVWLWLSLMGASIRGPDFIMPNRMNLSISYLPFSKEARVIHRVPILFVFVW